MSEYGLTPRQKKFADYYLETGNASQSYKKAGYKASSDGTADTCAFRLIRKEKIKQYIKDASTQTDNPRIACRDEVLKFLTSVMRGEVGEEIVGFSSEGSILKADKNLGGKDRVKAAELLGKRYQMFSDKSVIDHNISISFVEDLDES